MALRRMMIMIGLRGWLIDGALDARNIDRVSATVGTGQSLVGVRGRAAEDAHEGLGVDGGLVRDEVEVAEAHPTIVLGQTGYGPTRAARLCGEWSERVVVGGRRGGESGGGEGGGRGGCIAHGGMEEGLGGEAGADGQGVETDASAVPDADPSESAFLGLGLVGRS